MQLVISINCRNAAYEGDQRAESLVENLSAIAEDLMEGKERGVVRDYNGNVVGNYFFKKD